MKFNLYNLEVHKNIYDDNLNSIISLIEVNGNKIFLGGDLENTNGQEDYYANIIGKVDIMKLNHHDEVRKSNTPNFINTLNPKYVIKTTAFDIPQYYKNFLKQKDITLLNTGLQDRTAVVLDVSEKGNIKDVSKEYGIYGIKNNVFYDWKNEPIINKEVIHDNKSYSANSVGYILTELEVIDTQPNESGSFKKDNNGWWYQYNDGTFAREKWEFSNKKWYYFDASGYMVRNKWVGNYYLSSDGTLLTNGTTPDGYKVDENGKWINPITKSWVQDTVGWWYKHSNGDYSKNTWELIDGNWYYFAKNGYMVKNTWIGNYYLGKNGNMLTNTTTPDGYKVDENGKWINN